MIVRDGIGRARFVGSSGAHPDPRSLVTEHVFTITTSALGATRGPRAPELLFDAQ